jgi:predicted site-specific integrase-resolvase
MPKFSLSREVSAMKTVIYLRVGSEHQKSTVLERLKDIQQHCQSNGWIKTSAYVAEAINIRVKL